MTSGVSGFDDLKRLAFLVTASLLLMVPVQTWLLLGGDFSEYLNHETPPGQLSYLLAKLSALYALVLLWAQVLLGLLKHRLSSAPSSVVGAKRWASIHRALGLATLLLILTHVLLFVAATSLRNGHLAWDLLLPWGQGYYRTMVASGAAALWLAALAIAVRFIRRLQGRAKTWLHRLALVAVILVLLHSLTIGTESRAGWMLWGYGFMAISLLVALIDRLHRALRSRPSPSVSDAAV
jgi:predicted ferric reductase